MVLAHHKDTFTAPVFRSKPEIAVGFLRGGFWKYNAKPSNILALDEEIICGCRTRFCCRFGADGNLPRLRYLLESDPTAALEEYIREGIVLNSIAARLYFDFFN
ncbi:hypothetical protein L3X38_034602 [Prunus dulcis]|uniref:Uncharacterized protein n=1 Tax=Prunus dulcis TaxID=3755 RepID=A0AAD4VJJ1_PRUDU|nr:hypothetical protein L3X38_034602 [Prunus dulcis]